MSATLAPGSEGEVWAVIPARYGSTRFPGKPLALLGGKPMVQHVHDRALAAPSVKRVLVATDDRRIAEAVRAFGGEAVMTATQHATGTDRIAEAVAITAAGSAPPRWVLNLQGDEPLIDPNDLETLIQGLRAVPAAVMGTLVFPLENESELQDPNVVKALLDNEGRALYFSRAPVPFPRCAAPLSTGGLGWRHVGVYLYDISFLTDFAAMAPTPLSKREELEQLRALENGYAIHCFQASSLSVGVDVPMDLERAEAFLKKA